MLGKLQWCGKSERSRIRYAPVLPNGAGAAIADTVTFGLPFLGVVGDEALLRLGGGFRETPPSATVYPGERWIKRTLNGHVLPRL